MSTVRGVDSVLLRLPCFAAGRAWRRHSNPATRATGTPHIPARLLSTHAAGASRITWRVAARHAVAVAVFNASQYTCFWDDEGETRYTCDFSRIANQTVRGTGPAARPS